MPRVSHRSRQVDTHAAGRSSPWEQLLAVLDALRAELAANCVPAFLQRKLYVQLFSFINVQLFNQLLLRRECCSFANGEYVKNGLAQVRLLFSRCLCVISLSLQQFLRGPSSLRTRVDVSRLRGRGVLQGTDGEMWGAGGAVGDAAGRGARGGLLARAALYPAGGGVPGAARQAEEDTQGDPDGDVPRAERAAALPHQHHVLGRQVRHGDGERGGAAGDAAHDAGARPCLLALLSPLLALLALLLTPAVRAVQQQQGSASHSFLLDDDSSNPFNAADVQHVMDDKPLYLEIAPPEPLRSNQAFEFLYRDLKLTPPAASAQQ